MSKKRGPIALIEIDGWGYSASRDNNANALAKTPFYDELCEKYPGPLLD
jgi:bisphosphoglycerate-independent phosphoglycerate mutase (AlkP superfamily)